MYNFEKFKPINESPIIVDYNHTNGESGILLDTRGAIESIKELGITLKEGELVWISDSELDFLAVLMNRRDSWVAVPINATRNDLI